MEDTRKENVLYVRMFGSLSLEWNGKVLAASGRTTESQFVYLMQILLHAGSKGVSRDTLEKVLFENRDLDNVHHAVRSVVYNAKKKLESFGLPASGFIRQSRGVYYWTDEIPVEEDAARMESLYRQALEEKDLERKLGLYLDAVHCYTGDFLSNQGHVVWISQEARRYKTIFCFCVEEAAKILRMNRDFFQMEELGIYAARINPLADWETITMEALVAMGRFDDAKQFYEDTVNLYLQEQGLRPSGRLMELLNKLGGQIEHDYAVLDDIQRKLAAEDDQATGGYVCSYPVFQGIYAMVKRMMERGGQSVYLMLCTVVDSKGNPMEPGSNLDELSERLGDSIRHSVRHSDAINKYGRGQYLVLLVNTTRENCGIVQKRINNHFIIGRQRTGIQYYVNSVICTPDETNKLMGGKP